jgi:hypothetical protein
MWKNTVEPGRPQVTLQYGADKHSIFMEDKYGKSTDSHS